jgi:hypothetical protein
MMTAVGLPTLPGIQTYSVQHLLAAGAHWNEVADQWDSTFKTVSLRAQDMRWEGDAADAMMLRTHGDWLVATRSADQVREAARAAIQGADELDHLHQQVLSTVAEAQGAGFIVNPDLSVTDTMQTFNREQQAERQQLAQSYAGYIKHQAGLLAARDHEVGIGVTNAASTVTPRFSDGVYHGGASVQAMDNGTDNQPQPTPAIKLPPRTTPKPPTVINAAPPPDPDKHPCDFNDVGKRVLEVLGGATLVGTGLAGEIPTVGGTTAAILGGAGAVWDGFDEIGKCE